MQLPWRVAESQTKTPPWNTTVPPGVPVAIVVSNELGLGSLLAMALRGAKFHAVHTSSPHRALAEGQSLRRLDLIVTDMAANGMSGGNLLDGLRHQHPRAAAVLLSDHLEDESAPDPILCKPFMCQEFMRVIAGVTTAR